MRIEFTIFVCQYLVTSWVLFILEVTVSSI